MKLKQNKLIEKIINFLLNIMIVVFVVILLSSIYTSIQIKVLKNEYTDFFGYSIFEVQTGSMSPEIEAGDWIIVNLTKKVKLNDVVTYKLNNEFITHRVIEVYSGTYITQGDANNAKDDPVDQSQIVGKVSKVLSNFGILRMTLFNPVVLIACIITLFCFHVVFKKERKEKKQKSLINKIKLPKMDVVINNFKNLFDILIKNVNFKLSEIKNNINVKKIKPQKEVIPLNKPQDEIIDLSSALDSFEVPKNKDNQESDLEKTSTFRVIDAWTEDVDDLEKLKEVKQSEEELEKTSMFRVIPVDVSEIDNTFLEIAKNEMKTAALNEKVDEEKQEEEEEEIPVIEEALTKINLNLLKNNKSGNKSIINTAMLIKKDELKEIAKLFILDNKKLLKENTIKEKFLMAYIYARYYNILGDKDSTISGKNLVNKIIEVINDLSIELLNSSIDKSSSNIDIITAYTNIFIIIANLDYAKNNITELKAKREFYKKEINKKLPELTKHQQEYIVEEIMEVQRNYTGVLGYFLKRLETNMFELKYNKFKTNKDMYGLNLEHNVSFSRVYSDYIIEKTYTEGIIAEDKLEVLLSLLMKQLIEDMLDLKFNNKYFIYLKDHLYGKEKKLGKILKMIDDDYAQNNVIIALDLNILSKRKQILKKLRKSGYRFALVIDNNDLINDKEYSNFTIVDYVFINKENKMLKNILASIPEDLLERIIYEDITEKIGDFGSEKL